MKIKLLLISILVMQLFSLWQWVGCSTFQQPFQYSAFDLHLRLIDNIHNDVGVPLSQVRLFHNKPVGFVFDLFNSYLQFWNITFLTNFISLTGVVGLAAGFYYFFTKKRSNMLWLLLGYLLFAPFIEIFESPQLPYWFQLVFIAAPCIAWSLYGYWYLLMERKVNAKIIAILLLLSIWYQLALPTVHLFCS